MPPLSMMIKPASSACDLRCRYCFYSDVASHREQAFCGMMTPQTMRALVRRAFIYADDSITFAFQGGEPTLAGLEFYETFVSLVNEYNVRGLSVSYALQTNACHLSDALCALFAKHRFLIGVSLDGDRETHDAARVDAKGKGSYDRVLSGIALLKKHKVDFNILCVVTARTVEHTKKIWKALAPYGHLQFIPCINGFEEEMESFSLEAEAYGRFLIESFDLYEAAFYSGHPVSERRFDNYIGMLLGYAPEHCGMAGRCGLYFLIEADGSVYPCDFYALDEWRLGNVNETSLARIADSPKALAFREASYPLPDGCLSCKWRTFCRGGCRRDREPFSDGNPGENRFCESYQMLFDARFDRMAVLAERIRGQRV